MPDMHARQALLTGMEGTRRPVVYQTKAAWQDSAKRHVLQNQDWENLS